MGLDEGTGVSAEPAAVVTPAATALAELQERYERLQRDHAQLREHLPEAFVEVSLPEIKVTYMSQVALALLGYSRDDVAAGIEGYALLDDRSLVNVLDVASRHLAASVWAGEPYEREPGQRIFELTLIRKDGSRFPADAQGSYILGEGNIPVGIRCIFRDTTQRVAAEQERARLAALVESSDDAIISRDLDGAVLSWNRGAERMYGYSAEEMLGKGMDILETPEKRGEMAEVLESQSAGERRQIETKRRTRDGQVIDVSVSVFPVRDARGDVVAVGGIGRDIGERIRWAEAVKQSNDLLAALGAAQTQFIREGDSRAVFEGLLGDLLRVSGSEFGFIGAVDHDSQGEPVLRLLAATDISWNAETRAFFAANREQGIQFTNMATLFGHVVTTGQPVIAGETGNDPRSGGLPPGHPAMQTFMGLPIFVGERLVGMVAVANRPAGYDSALAAFLAPLLSTCGTIMEAMNIERARKAAEQRLDLAMRGAELALWEWDVRSGVMSAEFPESPSGFGSPHKDGALSSFLERVHPDDRHFLVAAFTRHATGEAPVVECEHRVTNARGEYRWILTRGTIVERDSAGRPIRGAGTFLDITERKLAEEERMRLEQQVRQSQKLESLGVFAGGIAHDFNNLLTAVIGNLYLLERGVNGPQLELVQEARHAADRGAELVKRLLTFARPEVSSDETVRLEGLLHDTAALARSALTPQVRLVVRRTQGDPEIRGSWTSLQQVLVNLMVNARDAMPEGGTLTMARRLVNVGPRHRWAPPDLPRGRYHLVTVRDTGSGITPDVVERIFDPFFTTKEVGRGSGLGLSTALGIARAHGGWLAVDTAPGRGSTFRLLLPVLEAADEDPAI
jgi:PAS domain S-box-containing protein